MTGARGVLSTAIGDRALVAGVAALAVPLAVTVALGANGVAIATVGALFAVAVVAGASPVAAVVLLLVWLSVQNLVAPALLTYAGFDVADVRGLLGTKELMAVVILAVIATPAVVAGQIRLLAVDKVWLAYGAVVLLYVLNPFVTRAEPFYLAVSARALLVPLLFYALGRLVAMARPAGALATLGRTALLVAGAAAAFGIIEITVLGDDFWRGLDIRRYWIEVKGLSDRTLVNDLPANFYGHYGLSGAGVRRMPSFYGESLAAANNLFFGALLCFAALKYGWVGRRLWRGLLFVILVLGLMLALSRAAIAALLLGIGLLAVRRDRVPGGGALAFALVTVLGLSLAFRHALSPAFVSAVTMEDPSARSHVIDLAFGLHRLLTPEALWGFGLGAGGLPAAASRIHLGVTESVYLVLYAQIGILGLGLFLAALVASFLALWRGAAPEREAVAAVALVTAAGLVGHAFIGLVSEQLFATTSAGVFWTVLGASVTYCARSRAQEAAA